MFSSTTLVCIVDLMCTVDLMCVVDHICLFACNACGGITAVAFSCCGILHLTLRGSTSLLFVEQHLDLHGIRAVLSSLGSYHRLDSCIVCGLYLCVLAT